MSIQIEKMIRAKQLRGTLTAGVRTLSRFGSVQLRPAVDSFMKAWAINAYSAQIEFQKRRFAEIRVPSGAAGPEYASPLAHCNVKEPWPFRATIVQRPRL
jgi:hypothetical protein